MNKFNTEERIEDVTSVSDGNDAYIDYRKFHYRNTVPDSRVLVFLTGFCIGMVFFYLSNGKSMGSGGLLDREHLIRLQSFEVNQSGLFEYVVGLRLRQLVFCVICSLSSISGLLAYSIMGWYGFEAGLIIFSLVYQYGIKGIFLTFSMFLPQGAFYVIAFLIIFGRHWISDTKSCHKEETIKGSRRHKKMENLKRIILVLVVFGIGILSEIYVNPEIVRKMALFFQ